MTDVDDARSRVVSVRLSADLYRLLKAYSALSERAISAVVAVAVEEYLRTHADEQSIAALVARHRASLRKTTRRTR